MQSDEDRKVVLGLLDKNDTDEYIAVFVLDFQKGAVEACLRTHCAIGTLFCDVIFYFRADNPRIITAGLVPFQVLLQHDFACGRVDNLYQSGNSRVKAL